RRKLLVWMMRSRSRWNSVRIVDGSSNRSRRAPLLRAAPGARISSSHCSSRSRMDECEPLVIMPPGSGDNVHICQRRDQAFLAVVLLLEKHGQLHVPVAPGRDLGDLALAELGMEDNVADL